ncbi:unnamed protein product [Rhizophagus irregularis]|nr:unnamed protein product [Rhizophagus irregularis]CAB4424193.1 unnamed protein product [Rhizophagus irregularis]
MLPLTQKKIHKPHEGKEPEWFSSDPEQESLRHLCEEYLSEVAKTMMFKDIETKLINKTIRKQGTTNIRLTKYLLKYF